MDVYHTQPFVVIETNGAWGSAIEVPVIEALNTGQNAAAVSISCATADSCAASGFYNGAFPHSSAFVVSETGGVWGTAVKVPGLEALNADVGSMVSISCATADSCGIGGSYQVTGPRSLAFVASP